LKLFGSILKKSKQNNFAFIKPLIESELSTGCNREKHITDKFCIKVINDKFANQMVILDEQHE